MSNFQINREFIHKFIRIIGSSNFFIISNSIQLIMIINNKVKMSLKFKLLKKILKANLFIQWFNHINFNYPQSLVNNYLIFYKVYQ